MSPLPEISPAERERLAAALAGGLIVETSGSTEKPKRVALSAEALAASARATEAALGRGNWVLALPLTYIAGIMVGIRAILADTHLVDLRTDTFDAHDFTTAIAALPEGTWFTSLVPTQLSRVVQLGETSESARDALRRFSAILVGGQAIPAGLVDRATALGVTVIRTYGSAETAGGVVYNGEPIGDTTLRIAADGVLEISTASLFSGYVGDPDRTADVLRGSWFRTSDVARIDNGLLVIEGRTDDIIVTGGVKVSLADIERVLTEKGIDVVASWFPDSEWGQVPAVLSETALDLDMVRELVQSALGKAARPYRVTTVESIPRLPSGKPDRRTIQEIVSRPQP